MNSETNRRKKSGLSFQLDLIRYQELLKCNLEQDIPPRRGERGARGTRRTSTRTNQEVPVLYNLPIRNTRSKKRLLEQMKQQQEERSKRNKRQKRPTPVEPLPTLSRPKYIPSTSSTITLKKPIYKSQTTVGAPPAISKETKTSFETKVLLDHTYPELINLIKTNMSLKNPELNTIDISLHHKLFPKNLAQETSRFEITPEYYNNENENLLLSMTKMNNFSNDIDMFFKSLNEEEASEDKKGFIPLV